MARAVWLYYMCKITELLDTVFFVLRKKQSQITGLHMYHHTLMPICGFIGIKYFAGKLTSFINIVNQLTNEPRTALISSHRHRHRVNCTARNDDSDDGYYGDVCNVHFTSCFPSFHSFFFSFLLGEGGSLSLSVLLLFFSLFQNHKSQCHAITYECWLFFSSPLAVASLVLWCAIGAALHTNFSLVV